MTTSFGELWYTIGALVVIAVLAGMVWELGVWWTRHPDSPAVKRLEHAWARIRHPRHHPPH
ncbi:MULTISPECIES: DUF2333 family protein [Pandoraea]|uniref:Uncharacterized protein n=1 Tax=Pandoraea capi TaxID=2508286 RepID=A0ABY6VNH0_9BURK|nr:MULTISPECIES: DUF2333 family protein [Pandoraea]VVD67947.1 hypothetical protein PCA20602_00463 [Pandoraea capi]